MDQAVISVYKDTYGVWPYSKQEAIIPRSEWEQPRVARMENESGYRRDYPAHAVEMRRITQRPQWPGFSEPFQAKSTHQAEYQYYPSEPAKKIEPKSELHLDRSSPMDVRTTAHDAYVSWNIPERFQHKREVYDPPMEGMDCRTSYGTDYFPHSFVKLPPIRPLQRKDSPKPFEGSSETRDAFRTYERHDVIQLESYKPKREYTSPIEKFQTTTSYAGEFTPRKGEKSQSFKPQRIYQPPEETFANTTSYSGEYTPRQLEKTQSFQPRREYRPPSKTMENRTTYQGQYEFSLEHRNLAQNRTQSYKPQSQYQQPTEPVSNVTSYTEKFSNNLALLQAAKHPVGSFKPLRVYEAPNVPVDGLSSYQGDFLGESVERPKAFRPKDNHERSSQIMQSETTMRAEYVPKSPERIQVVKPQATIDLKHHSHS